MIDEEILFSLNGAKIKSSNFKSRNYFIFIFFVIVLLATTYFFYLQFFEKEKLLKLEENIKTTVYFSFPPRGNIYDRNGKLLASSEQVFDVYLDLEKVPTEFNFQEILSSGRFFYRGHQLIVRNLPKEVALNLLANKPDFMEIIPSFKRKYLAHQEVGNLFGYVGFPGSTSKYHPEEFVGQAGLELSYQDYLGGRLGEIVYQKTKNGLKKTKEIAVQPGKNLFLTIEADFQKRVYELMADYFHKNGYQSGTFIALKPNTGEIISLISYPSYDPQWFLENPQKVTQVLNDKNYPLFNRAISGLYAPGSTVKLIVAAGALEEKIVNPETKIYAGGEIKIPNPYFPGRYSVFKDNKVHGWTDIYKAIADSVNVYFYVVGGGYPYPSEEIPIKEGLGIDRLLKYWRLYNLGQKSGIDLVGEKEGFLPSPETKARNLFDKVWRLGDTYNVAIGQGDLLVTPLQIALWTAAMATNKIYQPFLVQKITDENGKIIFARQPKILKENLIKEENLKIIQKAMRLTATQGTAKAYLNDLPVAGKSGTPEIYGKKKLNAIFTGYLPYDKPEIVMTLLIEDVPLGSIATLPLYREIVKAYLELNYGRDSF